MGFVRRSESGREEEPPVSLRPRQQGTGGGHNDSRG